jgi:molecular chaperone DnaK
MLIGQAREAVEREVSASEARELTSELQQVEASLSVARATEASSSESPSDAGDSDDVVDAEFDRS